MKNCSDATFVHSIPNTVKLVLVKINTTQTIHKPKLSCSFRNKDTYKTP